MTVHALLDFAGLAIGSVYATIPLFWLTVHPLITRWRTAGRRAYLALVPLWFAYALVAFAIGWRFRHLHLYISWMPWVPAVLFLLMGAVLYQAGRQEFRIRETCRAGRARALPARQEFVTTGIRSRVRHPIYLGTFCELFGWALGTGSLAVAGLAAFYVAQRGPHDAPRRCRVGRAFRRSLPAISRPRAGLPAEVEVGG